MRTCGSLMSSTYLFYGQRWFVQYQGEPPCRLARVVGWCFKRRGKRTLVDALRPKKCIFDINLFILPPDVDLSTQGECIEQIVVRSRWSCYLQVGLSKHDWVSPPVLDPARTEVFPFSLTYPYIGCKCLQQRPWVLLVSLRIWEQFFVSQSFMTSSSWFEQNCHRVLQKQT